MSFGFKINESGERCTLWGVGDIFAIIRAILYAFVRQVRNPQQLVVDFPFGIEAEAADFVEEACQRRRLPSDVHLKSRASKRFLDRIRDQIVSLP